MDPIFRDALKTFHRRGWDLELVDKRLIVRNWPTRDMRKVTTIALLLLQANECEEVVLENVLDLDCMQDLIELGWTQSCARFSLIGKC